MEPIPDDGVLNDCPPSFRPPRAPSELNKQKQSSRATRSAASQALFLQRHKQSSLDPSTAIGGIRKAPVDRSRLPTFTLEECSRHNTSKDCWMILGDEVYDITDYLDSHPGGSSILLRFGGQDATRQFAAIHSYVNYRLLLANQLIGTVQR